MSTLYIRVVALIIVRATCRQPNLLQHYPFFSFTTLEEVLRQMEVRHRKRQAATDSAHRRQLRE